LVIFCRTWQVNFSRTVWITFHCRRQNYFEVSVTSSAEFEPAFHKHGQERAPARPALARQVSRQGPRTGFWR